LFYCNLSKPYLKQPKLNIQASLTIILIIKGFIILALLPGVILPLPIQIPFQISCQMIYWEFSPVKFDFVYKKEVENLKIKRISFPKTKKKQKWEIRKSKMVLTHLKKKISSTSWSDLRSGDTKSLLKLLIAKQVNLWVSFQSWDFSSTYFSVFKSSRFDSKHFETVIWTQG